MYVYCVYLLCIYKYTHTVYIFGKYLHVYTFIYLYKHNIFFLNIYMYVFVFIYT